MKVMILCLSMFAVIIGTSFAHPRFLAIPLEDVEFVEVEQGHVKAPLIRVTRAAVPQSRQYEEQQGDQQFVASEEQGRFQRGIHGGGGGGDGGHHDHVDFGAHTGHHGAFGWYADFPVHKDH